LRFAYIKAKLEAVADRIREIGAKLSLERDAFVNERALMSAPQLKVGCVATWRKALRNANS
jgi:hypothetical protein